MRRRVLRAGRSCCYSRTILASSPCRAPCYTSVLFSLQYARLLTRYNRQGQHPGTAPSLAAHTSSGAQRTSARRRPRWRRCRRGTMTPNLTRSRPSWACCGRRSPRRSWRRWWKRARPRWRSCRSACRRTCWRATTASSRAWPRWGPRAVRPARPAHVWCRGCYGAARAREEAVSGRVLVGACAHQLWLPRSAHGRRARLPRSGSGGSRQEPRRPDALFAARGSARRPTRAALSSSWPDRMGLG